MKKNIISGIQPTNSLTIGNYLGVIKSYQRSQKNDNLMIFIADLHTITNPTLKSSEILEYKKSLVCMLLASGIDIENTKIFYQSDVLEHTNLAHVLLCHTTIGELNRMTQFKDKSKKFSASNGTEYIPTGIFTYPTLMAADILLYNVDAVIIGKDQKQHLELTRNIAIRMNKKYQNNLFKVPESLIEECGSKIMDLLQPEIKMSKSNPSQKGVIKLLDNPKDAYKKIMSAKTDNLNLINYDLNNQPGISNLLEIYSSLKNQTIKQTLNEVQKMSYGKFKEIVANEVEKLLVNLQTEYKKYYENFSDIQKKLLKNAENMRKIAGQNLKKVYLAIGINN